MTTLKKATMIRMPQELDSMIVSISNKRGISKNAVMIQALWEYVNQNAVKKVGE